MSRRDAVGWSPAKQVAAQPIPGLASRPIQPRNLCLFFCCSFLCNRRTLPTRAVASCVECSKQHAPTRAAISRWQRWGLAGRHYHPPSESQYPFARLLAREAARPPCWAALHLHQMRRCAWLQGWPIGPATRFQQRIATATNELHAAGSRKLRPCRGEMKLHAPSRLPFVFLTVCFWSTSLPVAFPFCHGACA